MEKIKIAFFDIDGTLVDMKKKRISERTVDALKHLKQGGVRLCIATGRPLCALPEFPEVEFDAFLTFNGSYCCTKEEVIYKHPLPAESVEGILRNAALLHRPVAIAALDGVVANGSDQDLEEYFAISRQSVVIAEDFEQKKKAEIYQMMLGCRKEEHAALLRGVKGAGITAWWDRAADIIPLNSGKGIGVEKILAYYGLSKKEAIAFGDGANDIEMLRSVGMGIAMGNAAEAVKEAADAVCGSAAEDGIAVFCQKHRLIGRT